MVFTKLFKKLDIRSKILLLPNFINFKCYLRTPFY